MTRLRMFLSRVWTSLRRSEIEAELEEEIRSHLEMREDDYRRRGMSGGEARQAALRNFGGVEQTKERYRDRYRFPAFDSVIQDMGYAIRTLGRNPGFTVTAILTLALGIGVNTAVFSIVNSILVRPLRYKDSDRIVRIVQKEFRISGSDATPVRTAAITTDELQEWRRQTRTLSHMAAYFTMQVTLLENGVSSGVRTAIVSPSLFPLLGAEPLLGRVLEEGDERQGANAIALLSYAAWLKYFSGDPDILHRPLTIGGRAYAIAGVMPEDFEFPDRETELWLPLVLNPVGDARGVWLVETIARLANGVSIEEAAAEANSLFLTFYGLRTGVHLLRTERSGFIGSGSLPGNDRQPDTNVTGSIELIRIKDELVEPVKPALFVLVAAVGFVLLIACANIANLLLARAARREAEIAVRASLGAGRTRLIRQLLTESVILAMLGGILGTLLAFLGVRLVSALGAGHIPRIEEVRLDLPIFAFTFAVSILTGILFGLAPAIRLAQGNHLEAIQKGVAAGSGSDLFGRNRIRSLLAITEIALAMILLAGSGLLIGSFFKLSRIWGYNAENLLTFRIDLPNSPDLTLSQIRLYDRLLAAFRELPNVRFAAAANDMPIVRPESMGAAIYVAGRSEPPRMEDLVGAMRIVSNSYPRTMEMQLIDGRDFNEGDRPGQPVVTVVNRRMAEKFFPNEGAVGQRIRLGQPTGPAVEIIGVVDDVRYAGLDAEPVPEIYLNFHQAFTVMPAPPPPPAAPPPRPGAPINMPTPAFGSSAPMFALRTDGDPLALVADMRRAVREMDSRFVVDDVATMDQRLEIYMARPRFYAVLLAIFSAIAVALATIGIYGLIAYSVSQRRREIGIRIALGAESRAVLSLVLRQGLVLSAIGIAAGFIGALGLTHYLEGMLFGISPTDPATLVIVAAMIALAVSIASYVPARRATRVDPVTALKYE